MARLDKTIQDYQKQLKEKGIENIPDFINSILNTDITKGKYSRFLLECFLTDKFIEEDLIGGLDSTIGQAISLFHKHKSKLPLEHRSVYALNPETKLPLYQSPGDLWNSVKQFQGELSGKELKKEEQEKIYRETEFIYKDEETGFQIISPLTEESAKWWGKGTRWCTSAEKNNLFWDYAEKSPLFILLMPNGDKLQFWKYKNNIQFMDEADNEVELKYIEQNWDILEPVCSWLNNLKFIPDEYRTKELYELAVRQNGFALDYISKTLRTPKLCEIAVKSNGHALRFIPHEYKTQEICELAVKNNGDALRFVPNEYKTPELCKLAVKNNKLALHYVPEKYKSEEIVKLAVQSNGMTLAYVPEDLKTYELCKIAVSNNGYALKYIPNTFFKRYKDYNMCKLAVEQNGMALEYIPNTFFKRYKDYNMCKLAVRKNGWALEFVPEKLKTEELCEMAVKKNGRALKYIPEELRDYNLCLEAIKQNGSAIGYVLEEYIIRELCELAVSNHGRALQDVPKQYQTYKLCELAIQNDGLALKWVPEDLKSKELCELAVKQNRHSLKWIPVELQQHIKETLFQIPMEKYQETFQEIKILFPIKDVSLSYHSQ